SSQKRRGYRPRLPQRVGNGQAESHYSRNRTAELGRTCVLTENAEIEFTIQERALDFMGPSTFACVHSFGGIQFGSMKSKLAAIFLFLILSPVMDAQTQPKPENHDESKVPPYSLPDPLVLSNGQKVNDAQAWREKRRPE